MTKPKLELLTVIFAVHEETPIACQGDDDQTRIGVIREEFSCRGDGPEQALRRSIDLSKQHGKYVQVWDLEPGVKK
ncbi:hypothetical protein BH11PSE11_BH11PSE11_15730 [soil metagenome]